MYLPFGAHDGFSLVPWFCVRRAIFPPSTATVYRSNTRCSSRPEKAIKSPLGDQAGSWL